MKKILYIISKQLDQDLNQLISSSTSQEYSTSVIFIQKGITVKTTWSFPCFVLEDDVWISNQATLYPKIQYSDMVRMLFEVDTVISL